MEMITVKHEEQRAGIPGVGRVSDSPVTSCLKRSRRDPVPLLIGNGDCWNQQISSAMTVKRSSKFRGVCRHRWTGRYEAHLWDKLSWNVTQKKKGKQVYLGAYDDEKRQPELYDLAALKYWCTSTFTNLSISEYENEIEVMQNMTKEEYLASLRWFSLDNRRSSGFSRGVSKYRGVAKQHHNERWEARIGRVFGNRYVYLGTYSTQEEAAQAYDIAAVEYRGINAVTNFNLSTYIRWLKPGAMNWFVSQEQPLSFGEPEMPTIAQNLGNPSKSPLQLHSSLFRFGSLSSEDVFDTKAPVNPFAMPPLPSPCHCLFPLPHLLRHATTAIAMSLSFSSSSSPSPAAVGLLLRSSVFRDLMEKNSKVSSEDDGTEVKNQSPQTRKDEDR